MDSLGPIMEMDSMEQPGSNGFGLPKLNENHTEVSRSPLRRSNSANLDQKPLAVMEIKAEGNHRNNSLPLPKLLVEKKPNKDRPDGPFHRQRSNSAHTIGSIRPRQRFRRRSGSLVALPGHKHYVPVNHTTELVPLHSNGPEQTTVTSFADFIQVSKHTKSEGAKYQKSPHKKMRRRLIYKNGDCNVTHKHIKKVKRHYLADIFTTLIDLKWRWALIIFIIAFVLTWLLFGLIWWIIGYTHGDFHEDEAQRPSKPCVKEMYGFVSALLYSIETQHTIGYGLRVLTDECPEAVVILMIQSIIGTVVQALMAGMIFAKLSRPKKRAETLMFSKNAVICQRDGELCLMFRIGDMRSSHLIEAHVRGMVIRRRVTKEGEVLPLDQQDVNLGFETGADRLLIVWPVIVIHKIDSKSPFWRMSRDDMERENFELLIILEGCIESTGSTTQARTSYLPSEIQWGHRLERLITFQKEGGEYQVDYSRFDNLVPVQTPTCSAKELALQQTVETNSDSDDVDLVLLQANSTQSSSSEEEDEELLVPEGETAIFINNTEEK